MITETSPRHQLNISIGQHGRENRKDSVCNSIVSYYIFSMYWVDSIKQINYASNLNLRISKISELGGLENLLQVSLEALRIDFLSLDVVFHILSQIMISNSRFLVHLLYSCIVQNTLHRTCKKSIGPNKFLCLK